MAEATLTQTDIEILLAVNRYDCLTIDQVMELFHWTSYRHAAQRLQKLSATFHVLERKKLPSIDLGGATWMHRVSERGKKAIQEYDPSVAVPRFAMGGATRVLGPTWWHTKYVNDVLICANRWLEETAGIQIARMETEKALFRRRTAFPKAAPTSSPSARVIPDGFLEIHDLTKMQRLCFCVEVETGSQEMAVIGDKVRNLVRFYDEGLEHAFGVDFGVFLFVAMGIKKRRMPPDVHRNTILTTITQTLQELQRPEMAETFSVTAAHPTDRALFTHPVWYVPGIARPKGLFEEWDSR